MPISIAQLLRFWPPNACQKYLSRQAQPEGWPASAAVHAILFDSVFWVLHSGLLLTSPGSLLPPFHNPTERRSCKKWMATRLACATHQFHQLNTGCGTCPPRLGHSTPILAYTGVGQWVHGSPIPPAIKPTIYRSYCKPCQSTLENHEIFVDQKRKRYQHRRDCPTLGFHSHPAEGTTVSGNLATQRSHGAEALAALALAPPIEAAGSQGPKASPWRDARWPSWYAEGPSWPVLPSLLCVKHPSAKVCTDRTWEENVTRDAGRTAEVHVFHTHCSWILLTNTCAFHFWICWRIVGLGENDLAASRRLALKGESGSEKVSDVSVCNSRSPIATRCRVLVNHSVGGPEIPWYPV